MPKLKVMESQRAQRLRHRPQREAIFDHGDHGAAQQPRRRRGRGRARPRAHPYPQRRRAHAGHRRDHRRRHLVLRRAGVPHVLPVRRRWRSRSSGGSDRGKGGARSSPSSSPSCSIAVAWFLSIVIRFALSRRREFLADAGSVELTKNPDAHDHGACARSRAAASSKARPPRSWKCASTTRARALPICSPPIPRSTAGSPRWCNMPAATTPVRLRCRRPRRRRSEEAPSVPSPEPAPAEGKPFLPNRPPIELGAPPAGVEPGPWTPPRGASQYSSVTGQRSYVGVAVDEWLAARANARK